MPTQPIEEPSRAKPLRSKRAVVAGRVLVNALRAGEVNGIEALIRAKMKQNHTPFMIIRKSQLIKQYRRFRKGLPRVEPFYAIKANPHPQIIKTLLEQNCGFDVASAGEMRHVLSLGAKPDKIIFANTIKSAEDIIAARRARVRMMTFDNESELYKISEHYPGAHVVLRIKVDNDLSVVKLSMKFGADPEMAVPLIRKAKSLGLKPVGVSFHAGSQSKNIENYLQAIELTANIFAQAEEQGISLNVVDVGGGFPIPHFDGEIGINFERMAQQIHKQLRVFDENTTIMAEPGRFFAGPAGILVTQVVGRAFRNNRNYYYLNDGVYQDFSGIVFDQCKYEFKTLRRGKKFLSALAGPTCDSFDTLALDAEIPELYVNDVVYVKNIGAYSSASAVANFNGFAPAKIIIV
ncbi:MAG: type III PLP-dependent enzyme [Candidatus Omnitrophota bacterium]|nr:type III PLP-dependent enzyme [Candidatus Omnitrophota bacterium]